MTNEMKMDLIAMMRGYLGVAFAIYCKYIGILL